MAFQGNSKGLQRRDVHPKRVIAAAYGVASDGNDSKLDSYELELYRRIQQYGVYAVMGRPVLYEREIRRMSIVNNNIVIS